LINIEKYIKLIYGKGFIRWGFNTPPLGAVQLPVDDGGVVNPQYDKFPIEPTIPRPLAAGLVD
jgi:hypothetical protein